jgi:DNA (cytosine-5)-methyltransferase 1
MKTLHLFAGAGGGLLGDLILGHTPIGAVELDPYCCRVLRERAAEGWFPELRVHEGDVRLFDPSEYAGRVDCIHAGFPCQPHSLAGRREGEADERNLWPDTARIIGELRPRFALLENVPGIVSNGYAAVVIGELSALGYDCRWAIISAADVGSVIERERWWCFAASTNTVLGTEGAGTEFYGQEQIWKGEGRAYVGDRQKDWLALACEIARTDDDVANRLHRTEALGNGQVPLQAALAWRILGGP